MNVSEVMMVQPQQSRWRFLAGVVLAIFAAPIATALCADIGLFFSIPIDLQNTIDAIGGGFTLLIIAFAFGWIFSILPVLVLGGIAVTIARCIGTKSPVFFAAAGLLAGLVMAWVDVRRSHNVFNILEAIPFLVGGCSSALAYWRVAER